MGLWQPAYQFGTGPVQRAGFQVLGKTYLVNTVFRQREKKRIGVPE